MPGSFYFLAKKRHFPFVKEKEMRWEWVHQWNKCVDAGPGSWGHSLWIPLFSLVRLEEFAGWLINARHIHFRILIHSWIYIHKTDLSLVLFFAYNVWQILMSKLSRIHKIDLIAFHILYIFSVFWNKLYRIEFTSSFKVSNNSLVKQPLENLE